MMRTLLVPALGATLLGPVCAQDGARAQDAVKKKEPAGQAMLDKALRRADAHNKRVVAVFVEADDTLASVIKRDKDLWRQILYEFEFVRFAGPDADAMARQLEFAAASKQKPAILVLDSERKKLAQIASAEFMRNGNLQGMALQKILEPHQAKPVDAEKKLAAALVDAKKTGRNVFIRFDAPW